MSFFFGAAQVVSPWCACMQVAFFPILGNHDYYTDPYAQIAHYLRNATLPDLVTGVNPPSTSATLEGPSGSPPAADLAKLAQAHAVFPWIHVKKSNKGVEFLKNGTFVCSSLPRVSS